jgi:hypothetical protein
MESPRSWPRDTARSREGEVASEELGSWPEDGEGGIETSYFVLRILANS